MSAVGVWSSMNRWNGFEIDWEDGKQHALVGDNVISDHCEILIRMRRRRALQEEEEDEGDTAIIRLSARFFRAQFNKIVCIFLQS